MNVYDYHPEARKCMAALRRACKLQVEQLCDYVSDDFRNYVSIICPVDPNTAVIHEYRAWSTRWTAMHIAMHDSPSSNGVDTTKPGCYSMAINRDK
jgi:hypothetical protein